MSMDQKRILEAHKRMVADGKIPKMLYKHTSISDNFYKILINAELWFAAPTSFNDPFDCQINDRTNWTEDAMRDYVKRISELNGRQVDPEDVIRKYRQQPGSFNTFFTDHFKAIISKIG